MSNSMHSASGSYHYSPAFGLDAVPEVGGLVRPRLRRRRPTMGCLAPYGRRRFREAHISLDAMTTGPAIRTYNVMLMEGRRLGAGLIAIGS
ncbi:MAG: Mth938-like domain-containing protein [Xanthobacteraceae bacterium]